MASRLLLEGARANLIADPRTPFQTGWTNAAIESVVPTTGPDGSATSGGLVTESTAAGQHSSTVPSSVVLDEYYVLSRIHAPGTRQTIQLLGAGAVWGVNSWCTFGLTGNGQIGNTGTTALDPFIILLPNGFYWFGVTFRAVATNAAGTTIDLLTPSVNSGRAPSYTGTGAAFTAGLAWLEAGRIPSSPILPPVRGLFTRQADRYSMPWNYVRGSVFWKGSVDRLATVSGQNQILFQIDDGTSANRILVYNAAGSDSVSVLVIAGGVTIGATNLGTVAADATIKVSLAYSPDGYSAFLDGGTGLKTVAVALTAAMTTLRAGSNEAGTSNLFGWQETLNPYPVRMSDTELVSRTSSL